jgi:hypothetical protein
LQWFIEIGLIGTVFWIVAMVFTIHTARKWEITIFVFSIALAIVMSIMFESLFERQSGILAIVVSLCLISSNKLITIPKTNA